MENIHENLSKFLLNNKFNYDVSKMEIVDSSNENEGKIAIATNNLEPGGILGQIPHHFLINARFVLKDVDLVNFFKWCKLNKCGLTRLDAMYIYIISQRFDKQSFLYEYMTCMPSEFSTPEFFATNLIECLPTYLRNPFLKAINDLETRFRFLSELIKSYFTAKMTKMSNILAENFTFSSYRWAFNVFKTRNFCSLDNELCNQEEIHFLKELFDINEFQIREISNFQDYEDSLNLKEFISVSSGALIPLYDFFIHSNESNIHHYFDTNLKCHVFKARSLNLNENVKDQQKVNVANNVNKDTYLVRKNQQLSITYGHWDNLDLLVDYGFILESNIHDKLFLKEADFVYLLDNKEDFTRLCSKASTYLLFENLSIDKQTGPSLNLIKLF
jgi:hypothetical protein